MTDDQAHPVNLAGVHHVAYRCKDAKETVDWYRKVLGMEYTSAFSEDHVPSTGEYDPYMHEFLDAGNGNVLAFFELPTKPEMGRDPDTPKWVQHIAFKVADRDTLVAFKEQLEANGVEVLIEPINPDDMPGYFVSSCDIAAEVIDKVGAPNLGMQFDAYHAHLITGDATACLRAHAARVRHVQIAGVGPAGRVEPSAAPIDYPAFLRTLADGGYTGWVSAEYVPATITTAGLGWMAALPA